MTKTRLQRAVWTALLAVGALAGRPASTLADTILDFDVGTGTLNGNATTPPTAFCAPTSNCPGTPAFGLATSEPLSGTVSFDLGSGNAGTMSFDLTLTQNATLGSIVLDAGSTFIATSVGIQYSSSTSNKGVTTYTIAPAAALSSVAVTLLPGSAFTEIASQASLPGIVCSANSSNGSGSCQFTIGTQQAGTQSLEIDAGGSTYNGVLAISTSLTAVPLPASALLLLSGLGPMLLKARRRRLESR